MARWVVSFIDAAQMGQVRADRARRAAHIDFMRAHPQVQIGGALAMRPMQDFPGAIWTVEAETRQDVERLIRQDPYFSDALRRYQIRRWDALAALLPTDS